MKAKIPAFLCLFCFMLLLGGCAGLSDKDDPSCKTAALLEPSSQLKFTDLPVPVGFKLLPKESYTFQTSGMRVGVLKYKGKAGADQVVNFYKEQMPMCGWSLLNVMEYGDRILNFERESETCIVNLSPKGGSVIITASVGPKSRMLPKKDKGPVK